MENGGHHAEEKRDMQEQGGEGCAGAGERVELTEEGEEEEWEEEKGGHQVEQWWERRR